MKKLSGRQGIEAALAAVGDLLAFRGGQASIVVAGGAALNLLGVTNRATIDVDVLARAAGNSIEPPDPLPPDLVEAVRLVARDRGLREDWINTAVAGQWRFGLPPGLETRIEWRRFGALGVGLVSRRDLVFFKVYASADQTGPDNVHTRDLLALRPTDEELDAAKTWVAKQDPGPGFHDVIERVINYVRAALRNAR